MLSTSSKTHSGDSDARNPDAELAPTFALKPEQRDHAGDVRPAPTRSRPETQPKLATIEGYEILSELGRGGMAIVFKARQLALNRIVALKMVLGGEYREPEFHIRFQMEAEAVARLQHPNIIQIFDYSTISGMFPGESRCPYIAFEFASGGNLNSRIRGLPQSPHEAARIVEILADAIQYAHRAGIIHRDLKPANVLLTADGVPKISDFGLAKLLDHADPGAALTATGAVLGTPEYMSPEQTRPNCRVSHSTDIYALGVILYELLTGRRPFEGGTVLETVDQVCNRDAVRPRALQTAVPRDLETICLKCLRKEPRQRYSTAQGLADDLRRFRNGQPIIARPVGPLERTWKWARRHHSLAALLFFTLALVIFGLPAVTFLWITADQAKQEALVKAHDANTAKRQADTNLKEAIQARDIARDLRRDGELREARLALDQGLTLCQQGQVDRGLLLLARSLDLHAPFKDAAVERAIRINIADWSQQLGRTAVAMEQYPGKGMAAIFLPGETALVANDFVTRQFSLASGKAISEPLGGPVYDSIGDPYFMVLALKRSRDQKTVAIGRTSGGIQLWDIDTQKPLNLVIRHKRNVWGMDFCPISDRLAACHDDDVVIWNRMTGERVLTIPHRSPSAPVTVGQVAFDPTGEALITAAWDGKIRIFDSNTGELKRELHVQNDRLGAMALSADGKFLAVAGREGKAQIFTYPELTDVGMPLRHLSAITSMVFSPDGRSIVTGGRDDTARVWEVDTGRPLAPPLRCATEVNWVDISPDGRRCLVATNDGAVALWELPAARQQATALAHRYAVDSLAFLADGSLLVGCANAAYIWDAANGDKRNTLSADRMRLRCAAVAPDGNRILTGRWDDAIWQWNTDAGKIAAPRVIEIGGSASLIACAEKRLWFSNTSKRLKLYCVDLETGKTAPECLTHPSTVLSLAVRPDECMLAAGCRDGGVRLWDAVRGDLKFTLSHPDRVEVVCFSKDGVLLATGCRDGVARLWNTATGRLLVSTTLQQSPIMALSFNAEGTLLATGGGDRSARFWDTATGIMLGAPLWHSDAVQAVAFDPAGKLLATGCRDGIVRFWTVPAKPTTARSDEIRALVERSSK